MEKPKDEAEGAAALERRMSGKEAKTPSAKPIKGPETAADKNWKVDDEISSYRPKLF